MVRLTRSQISWGQGVAFLGLIQGLVWFILSLICIIEYEIVDAPQASNDFNSRVYYYFLYKHAILPKGTLVNPLTFSIFMWLYVVFGTVWMAVSGVQLNAVQTRHSQVSTIFKNWALITCWICVLDFVLVVLIGIDYDQRCLEQFGEKFCRETVLPVLVVASRGFVLWILNVFLAYKLFSTGQVLKKAKAPRINRMPHQGTALYYGGVGGIPRANVSSTPSLYSQQLDNLGNKNKFWNVNLHTAMASRTPPTSPVSPNNVGHFFNKY